MQVHTLAELGTAVRSARKALGLTQDVAAATCGVSVPFLNQLEGGKRAGLSTTKVLEVCAALGLQIHVHGPGQTAEDRHGR
ncbi:helix-turn-helix domain-containing protein [Aquincola sp. S2]|uniref:Helix-turn-helix domain-containing protein n=1 Tax=Pseudaquabacterium terrae TaxID=2732868 RepID=A0ABX2EEB4_9BURK|nr:helix-turn-helix domain-containing protein [Aquabacterium terrae]NRF66962.1 helix-turn-helix domain-containing protein [Aquabacterium terrae]